MPDHPEGAVRHGPASVIEFFREWIEPWDELEVDWELEQIAPDRGARDRRHARPRHGSGVPTEMRFFQLWTFRDGRAVRMELYGRGRGAPRGGAVRAVRVVAGEFKGRRLVAPRGSRTRPTADRVREALFSMLGDVSGARVLDLYAGSGALGIEALSRGAESAVFVERDRARARRARAQPRGDRRARRGQAAGCRAFPGPS